MNTSISVYTDPVSENFLFLFQLHISLFTRYRVFMTGFPDSSIRSNLLLCMSVPSSNTFTICLIFLPVLSMWGLDAIRILRFVLLCDLDPGTLIYLESQIFFLLILSHFIFKFFFDLDQYIRQLIFVIFLFYLKSRIIFEILPLDRIDVVNIL